MNVFLTSRGGVEGYIEVQVSTYVEEEWRWEMVILIVVIVSQVHICQNLSKCTYVNYASGKRVAG